MFHNVNKLKTLYKADYLADVITTFSACKFLIDCQQVSSNDAIYQSNTSKRNEVDFKVVKPRGFHHWKMFLIN